MTATGSISISDVDDDDSPIFNDVASTLGDNAYGSFTLTSGTWTYTLDQSAVQHLDVGDVVNDTITYTATDGSSQQIIVTITGSEDAAVIGGTDTGTVTQDDDPDFDGLLETSGTLTVSDPDAGESAFTPGTYNGTYGDITIDALGNWSYAALNNQVAIQSLGASDTLSDVITVTSSDGTAHNITITIAGSNDAAVIGGTDTGSVTEETDPDADGLLEAVGTLTISDPDSGESSFAAGTVAGVYGSVTINTAGEWTYSVSNNHASIQGLGAGDTLTDVVTVSSFDGTTHDITITINGTEDDPVITGTVVGAVLEGDIGDAAVTASGSITISDVDDDDSPVFNDVSATTGDNGYGVFTLTSGTWVYTLDQSAVQNLDAGDVVNDTITYTATDGSSQQITVTITGSGDTSVITGTVTGAVTEGNVGDAPVTATGSISISDVDDDDSPVFNDVPSTLGDNAYGSFTLTAGTWTYTLDQSTVQNLDAGDVVNDTITYTATDGSSQQITVTITGSDDTSVITGTVTGAVVEGNVGDAPVTATGSICDLRRRCRR